MIETDIDEIPRYIIEDIQRFQREPTAQNEYEFHRSLEKIRYYHPRLYREFKNANPTSHNPKK